MTPKEIFAIGMLAAFLVAGITTITPAPAQNTIDNSDDDSVGQSNTADNPQTATNTATVGDNSDTNSVSASSTQSSSQTQSNGNTDDDTFSVSGTQEDND